MDAKKLEILELLQKDCRNSLEKIAVMVGLSPEEVAAIIDELEEARVILSYQGVINWEKAGVDSVSAMIDVSLIPQREVGFDDVAKRIYRYPEVKSVFLMSGGYDLAILVEGKSLREVAYFVSEKLATIEHVQQTATHFILKKYKQSGVILEGDEAKVERLVVSP